MVGMAFVVGIIYTLYRFAVDADDFAGVNHRTLIRIHSFPLLGETFTTGFITAAGMLSAHHNVSLAAQMLIIITAIFYRTL